MYDTPIIDSDAVGLILRKPGGVVPQGSFKKIQEAEMGFLEVCVEMFQYAGAGDYSPPSLVASLLLLIAALLLALNLRVPSKDDQF